MAVEGFRVEGLAGVLEALKALPPEIVSKAGGPVRVALRAAANVIRDEARANVRRIVDQPNIGGRTSESTGALQLSIVAKRIRQRTGVNGETFFIGIGKVKLNYIKNKDNVRKRRVGKSYEVLPPTYYGWFLEFGTEKMRAHPFMRPAFDSKKGRALEVFVEDVKTRITAVITKLDRASRSK